MKFMTTCVKRVNRTPAVQEQVGFLYPAGSFQVRHEGARSVGWFGVRSAGGRTGEIHADGNAEGKDFTFTSLEVRIAPVDAAAPEPLVIKLE